MTRAQDIDPASGKPDPAAIKRFFATHLKSAPFAKSAKTADWTASWADQDYNSLNAFRFIDAAGNNHLVRWSMKTTIQPTPVPHTARRIWGQTFFSAASQDRLTQRPLTWHLIATFAAPEDPSKRCPTKAWPSCRQEILDAGTLVVEKSEAEADGPCRDLNYDPTILPAGMTRFPMIRCFPHGQRLMPGRSTSERRNSPYYPRTVPHAGDRR